MTSDDRPSLEEALANARAWQAQSAAAMNEQPAGPAEQGDAIEVLTHGSLRLAKRVHADGKIDSYDDAKMFKRRTHQVRNLEGFYELLRDELQDDPHTAIIRGRWRGPDQVATDHDKHAQPNYVRKALQYFEDQPLHLVCIDVDKYMPCASDPLEADAVAEFIAFCLPAEFQDAAYCWQMSNSAGFKPGLRAHIWFWLADPLTSAQLKAWANSKWQGDSPVDVALFQPTQWHYTSAPVLDEGVVDPVPVRSGFVPGGEVRLVISDGVRAAVAPALTALDKPRDLADSEDPYVPELYERRLVLQEFPGKGLGVICSNHDSHSGDSGPTQSMYFPAGTGGRNDPGYECMHEHCKDITAHVYLRAVGIIDYAKDFELVEWSAEQEAANAIIRARNAQKQPLSLDNFYAHAPSHKYLYRPTRELWPAQSVNGMVRPWPTRPGKDGKPAAMTPAAWLDANQSVQQMTWAPGQPELIVGQVMSEGGWMPQPGNKVFNTYVSPRELPGDAEKAGLWLDHLKKVYPDDWQHLLNWFAHRVQRPGEKVNHALVLGGAPGIGKDSILVPVRAGVGPSNVRDISPGHIFAAFNDWAAAVLLVVSEARDLGENDRFKFYEASKSLWAAPPENIRVNQKHVPAYYILNLLGGVITTNHRTSGLYLAGDDRRHYVAWSEATRDTFEPDYWTRLYNWYAAGGIGHVVAYLKSVDLSAFDAKAPPPKTPAFWTMVAAGEAPEAGELRAVIEALGSPQALTVSDLVLQARVMGLGPLADEMTDRRSRTRIPHMLNRVNYIAVRNESAKDGRFGKLSIYASSDLTPAQRIAAARELERRGGNPPVTVGGFE